MIDHPALDTLHRMLCLHQLRAAFFANPTFCNDWQVAFDGQHRVTFHLVDAGRCRMQLDTAPTSIALQAGDLVVVPQHRPHLLRADSEQTADVHPTILICGAIEIGDSSRSPLLEALPECIVIKREDTTEHSALRGLLELLTLETRGQTNGCQLVLDKLAGALFAMVLRHYVCTCRSPSGVLAGLNDARLRPVLTALHTDIGVSWQLKQLAALAGMSRSAFAERFKRTIGMPPQDYLIWWRMTRADALLRDARLSVAQVAETLGYSTEAAFRRAFKRFFGIGPGRVRRERKAQPASPVMEDREPIELPRDPTPQLVHAGQADVPA